MEWSSTSLRVLRSVAEHGSFTAAASALGYTQSAVSRQVASLERAAGVALFERGPGGVTPTPAGRLLVRHASIALDEVDRVARVLDGEDQLERRPLRLGVFSSLGAALVPGTLDLMHECAPHVQVVSREESTPALVAALRAGTLDVAVIGLRPPYPVPDEQDPPLSLEPLLDGELLVAVPAASRYGRADGVVDLAELAEVAWVSSPRTSREPAFGTWPALQRRPHVDHLARDWLTKLTLVARGHGVTTVPPYLASVLPPGVRLVRVADSPPVLRRASIARLTDHRPAGVDDLVACLHEVADELPLL